MKRFRIADFGFGIWLTAIVIVALALGVLAAPLAAEAQPPAKIPRVGWLGPGVPPNPFYEALLQGLRDLGYVEGRNILIEQRWAEGKLDQLPALAAELARLNLDVIITALPPAIQAVSQATKTTPIVMVIVHDPVAMGLVASLARPGGNLTGLSCFAPELSGKLLEVVKETIPRVNRVGLLSNPVNPSVIKELGAAGRALGVEVRPFEFRSPGDLAGTFSAMAKDGMGAVMVEGAFGVYGQRRNIANLAIMNRLATMFEYREYVDAGGLMSYGPSYTELYRRAATFVDKILKGAKPADLPVERATRFELVINLKTAKALGLTIPRSVLIRADQVIQ
ncbi:MAG: ABC transporter substrate-binding protein [candidate division NC10 bacterium]|nr:ABC transporter substrate-binding protein [candidate division NC10 bacterium]MBI2115270.1 ABC transporter substrate-binding protein [candidate division NC10 bacterium]MBI2458475.1 ABC transporter substrate-binding protein [candidate division NC10 bacterium]